MAARRLMTLFLILALFLGAGLAYAHAARSPLSLSLARPPAAKPYLEGEMLVKFKDNVTPEQIAAFNAETGCTIAETLAGLGIHRLLLPEGADVLEMVAVYQASELVEFAEPNHRVSIPALPGPKPAPPAPRNGFKAVPTHLEGGDSP